MTTILKALQELEARSAERAPTAPPSTPPPSIGSALRVSRPRARRPITIGGAVVALAVAIVVALGVGRWSAAPGGGTLRRSQEARPEVAPAAASHTDPFVAAQPASASARAVVAPPNAKPARADEPDVTGGPIARTDTSDAPRATLLPSRADDRDVDVPRHAPVSARPPDAAAKDRAAASAPAAVRAATAPAANAAAGATAPAASARGNRRAASGSAITVSAITYSADASERTAALRIDGEIRRVRQGDSLHGVDVQLITPHTVYLRRGGEIFAVDPER